MSTRLNTALALAVSLVVVGCAQPGKVFVGQRQDPFAVNLGTIFDLVNAPVAVITDPANPLVQVLQPGTFFSVDLNGTAASSDQPPSKRAVLTAHTGFQSPLYWPSAATCPSMRPPTGLTLITTALRRSKKVSKPTAK